MSAGARYSIEEQIACVKREIGMRERLYPRWVVMRKMSQAKADEELDAMKAALGTLERISGMVREAELRRAGG